MLGKFFQRAKSFLKDLYREVIDDKVFDSAAALAYYLFLAIFPLTILILSILPYLPLENYEAYLVGYLHQALPGQAAKMIEDYISAFLNTKHSGLLSFGVLGTLWAASSGVHALMQQLNITYDVDEGRPYWKVRLIALGLVFLFLGFMFGSFVLITGGDWLIHLLQHWIGFESFFAIILMVLRWVVSIGILLLGFACVYYFGPDVKQRFRYITPGSLIGAALFVVSCMGFRFYVDHFGNYSATYGSLGAVIIFMLWLYVLGLVLLLGSEINAITEFKFFNFGKNRGDKDLPEKPQPNSNLKPVET